MSLLRYLLKKSEEQDRDEPRNKEQIKRRHALERQKKESSGAGD
jgi:hypothetical protein